MTEAHDEKIVRNMAIINLMIKVLFQAAVIEQPENPDAYIGATISALIEFIDEQLPGFKAKMTDYLVKESVSKPSDPVSS